MSERVRELTEPRLGHVFARYALHRRGGRHIVGEKHVYGTTGLKEREVIESDALLLEPVDPGCAQTTIDRVRTAERGDTNTFPDEARTAG